MRKLLLKIFITLFLTLFATCDLQKSVDPIGVYTRIIPGESIDGIYLGENLETVEKKLGANKLRGYACGTRAWTVFTWPDSPHTGLEIYFIDYGNFNLGPVDYLQVEAPYDGTTYEGIGIGTHMRDVHRAWGEPVVLNDQSPYYITYTYCFENKKLFINFEDSLLKFLSFGPFIPYADDTTCTGN